MTPPSLFDATSDHLRNKTHPVGVVLVCEGEFASVAHKRDR
ncbi:MAG: hypothetical protein Q4D85_12615 [Corynebacterium sp.]|nr:hypothetical protein [Corynebacterium sp.]MDO5099574.1 hypothetical protein [Corynebacterium sp.]